MNMLSRKLMTIALLGLIYGCDGGVDSTASGESGGASDMVEAGESVLEVEVGDDAGTEAGEMAGTEAGEMAGTEAGEMAGMGMPPGCMEGDRREGETRCGLNDEGTLVQICRAGQWMDTTECSGVDICVNDDRRQGETRCGLNDEGTLTQICTEGRWQDSMECSGVDVCAIGDLRQGNTVCGLNDEGTLTQECQDGQWIDLDQCDGMDICINNQTQPGRTVCGVNDEGTLIQICIEGQWGDSERCSGVDVCVNGETRESDTVCGIHEQGVLLDLCEAGQWSFMLTCAGDFVCEAGEYQVSEEVCGLNESADEGVVVYFCSDEGAWSSDTYCANFMTPTNINDLPQLTTELGLIVDVPPYCEISEVSVDIELEHSYIEDLILTLISPTGHEVILRNRRPRRRNELVGNYPATLDVEDEEAFDQLIGMKGFGLWRLRVADEAMIDDGEITTWDVNITCLPQC